MALKRQVEDYHTLTNWYNAHYEAHGTWATTEAYSLRLLELLREAGLDYPQSLSLLDVACGGGFFLYYIQSMFSRTYGCDISKVALQEAQTVRGVTLLSLANGEHLPFRSRAFDVVTCLGSLEHFLNIDVALLEFRRVLKPKGLALLLVPTNPDWAIYDIQPTEVVLDGDGWQQRFKEKGFEVMISQATDADPFLRESSAGCHVFCLQTNENEF